MTVTARAVSHSCIELAEAIVSGQVELPGLSPARAVCVLARQQLEVEIDHLLQSRGRGCPRASMRARLICLDETFRDDSDLVLRVNTAWWRLSQACHHHAYELGPTLGEAAELIDLVASLRVRNSPQPNLLDQP